MFQTDKFLALMTRKR